MTELEKIDRRLTDLEKARSVIGEEAFQDMRALLLNQKKALLELVQQREQRKYVTVLFADVSGYTAMSKSMDSEYVKRQVMDPLWQRLDRVIQDHGGMVDKHMGDGLMAVFGAPSAQENDPERAVRASLAMQEALAAFCAETELTLAMRIGIHSGHAFLGRTGANKEYTAYGDTVNTASRLENAAPTGGILISQDTYQHVQGLFVVEEWEPITVKGKEEEPIQVYEVRQAAAHVFTGPARGWENSVMVGRDGEMRRLQDAFATAVEDQQLQFITIIGELGIGKTRLLMEFTRWLHAEAPAVYYLKGRASHASPYALIRTLLTARFDIGEKDTPADARQKLIAGLVDILGESGLEKAHFIGHLIGLPFADSLYLQGIAEDSEQIFERALQYMAEMLAAIAQRQPVAILLEDTHWADGGSLDFLQRLAQACRDLPLLMVALARPSLYDKRPYWGEGYRFHDRIDLRLLSKRDGRRLVTAILKRMEIEIPAPLQDLITTNADGNPFYLEELIRMLADEGALGQATAVADVRVPPTLFGVLQARLDRLNLAEQTTLQRAAVVGRIFWDKVVAELEVLEQEAPANLEARLEMLRQRAFVDARQFSTFDGAKEYTFHSSLLRDTAYETVLSDLKQKYHARVAEWLLAQYGSERALEHVETIAGHYEKAGDMRQAADWTIKAGQQATRRHALDDAEAYYRHALTLLPEEAAYNSTHLLVFEELGRVLSRLARYDDAIDWFEQMRTMAQSVGDDLAQARSWILQSEAQGWQGEYQASLQSAEQAQTLAQTAGGYGMDLLGQAWLRQGWNRYRLRQLEPAVQQCNQTLALSKQIGQVNLAADALYLLMAVRADLGEPALATEHGQLALKLYRSLGDQQGEMRVLTGLGIAAYDQAEWDTAVALYQQTLQMARRYGNRSLEITALYNIGEAQLKLALWETAEVTLGQVVNIPEAEQVSFLPLVYAALARTQVGQSQWPAALDAARQAVLLAEERQHPYFRCRAWLALADLLAQMPDSPPLPEIESLVTLDDQFWPADMVAGLSARCFAFSSAIAEAAGMKIEARESLEAWAEYAAGQNQPAMAEWVGQKRQAL